LSIFLLFLSFFSFVFYFAAVLGGPAFELREYLDFIEMKNWYPKDKPQPSTYLACFKRFIHAINALVIHIFFAKVAPIQYIYTDEFTTNVPFLLKWIYLLCVAIEWRTQYYFAWVLSESVCILSGFGFNGYDKEGNILWDRLINVRMLKIEFCSNPRAITIHWNITAAKWLRNHIYLRFADKNGKAPEYVVYIVMIFSAFWHGFYPGYYVYFFTCSMGIHIARVFRRYVRPYFITVDEKGKETNIEPWKTIYDILGTLFVSLLFAMVIPSFHGLSFQNGFHVFESVYFTGHIALILSYIFVQFIFPRYIMKYLPKPIDLRQNKKEE